MRDARTHAQGSEVLLSEVSRRCPPPPAAGRPARPFAVIRAVETTAVGMKRLGVVIVVAAAAS